MKLFSEFPPVSAKEWEDKIIKDLKIPSIDELYWHTPENISIRPFYHPEHLSSKPNPLFYHTDWDIVQYVPTAHHSEEEINEHIIKSLNGGASGIYLEFYQKKNFSEIFNNISLPHIYSNLQISFDALDLISQLSDIYLSQNEFTHQKHCYINIDPIYLLEKFGEWHHTQQNDFEILHQLNHIPVNATLYKESGANVVQELAFTLAHLNEYLYYLEQKNQIKKYQYIHIHLSVGNSLFTEIAKLRALRILIHHLLNEYKHSANIHIHAQTTLLNKSYLDIHNNIIRTTTESISAILGGANSISIFPFDFPFHKISDFSMRIARNQLLIMKEEGYFNKTSDISAGNFYIENYTQQLVNTAYQKFLDIEKQNGIISLLEQNIIQKEIEESFEQQVQKYIENKEILTGVNKYPNPKDSEVIKEFYSPYIPHHTPIIPLLRKRWASYFEHQKQKV